jgi:hypothetical protein
MIEVIDYTGQKHEFATIDDAFAFACDHLDDWMEATDSVARYPGPDGQQCGEFVVVDDLHMPTDACVRWRSKPETQPADAMKIEQVTTKFFRVECKGATYIVEKSSHRKSDAWHVSEVIDGEESWVDTFFSKQDAFDAIPNFES